MMPRQLGRPKSWLSVMALSFGSETERSRYSRIKISPPKLQPFPAILCLSQTEFRVMAESNDRKELKKRLEQARRIAALALDPLTRERLARLVQELEEQLRLAEEG